MGKTAFRLLWLILGTLCAGCNVTQEHLTKLPTFDQALTLAPSAPKKPKLFLDGTSPRELGREFVSYARVDLAHNQNWAQGDRLLDAWERCLKYKPDAVWCVEGGSSYAGSVGQYWGLGVSTATPIYQQNMSAFCMRAVGATLPFRAPNHDNMVMILEGDAAAAGMLEGDTIVSIDGIAAPPPNQSADLSDLAARKLSWKPGQQVKVVWIRPGKGRMDGTVTLLPNPATHSAAQDAIDLTKIGAPKLASDGTWQSPRATYLVD